MNEEFNYGTIETVKNKPYYSSVDWVSSSEVSLEKPFSRETIDPSEVLKCRIKSTAKLNEAQTKWLDELTEGHYKNKRSELRFNCTKFGPNMVLEPYNSMSNPYTLHMTFNEKTLVII